MLTDQPVTLERIPRVRDIRTMEELLEYTGARVVVENSVVTVDAGTIESPEAPYDVVKTMRASAWCLGHWWGAAGAPVSPCPADAPSAPGHQPARCRSRTFWSHDSPGTRLYRSRSGQRVARGRSSFSTRTTVTGTEDLLMAAVLARGETVINNTAREPEVVDLCALLSKMGAKIEGAGTSVIRTPRRR